MECMIKQYRTCKPLMSIMCGEIIFYHNPRFFFFFFFFLWLENVVNQNYNKWSKLTLTQKLVEASKSQSKNASHVSTCPT